MKVAFVFPGQGSQTIGMGFEFFEAFSKFREVMEEVDDQLGEKLSRSIFKGSQEDLTLTHNAQPALLSVSMGMVRVIENQTGKMLCDIGEFAAGHSLGEYSALCAAEVFSIPKAAALVRKRGLAMQDAVAVGVGAMSAVLGAEMDLIESTLADVSSKNSICCVANDNSPGQVVISGHKHAVEMAEEALIEKGVKRCVQLPVSAPFHSPLMQPAADVMNEALSNTQITTPALSVLMNVTAMPLVSSEFIQKLLVEQITGRVRWRETLLNMQELGVTHLVEIGAGRVLTGLAKRTIPDIQTFNISTPKEMEDVLKIIN
jgi:[acyl-carrier-protein] S-malonyltransferase